MVVGIRDVLLASGLGDVAIFRDLSARTTDDKRMGRSVYIRQPA